MTTNWLIDLALFGGLLLCFPLQWTGLELHQVLGSGFALLAGYHLLAHWGWVESVSRRLRIQGTGELRLFYLLDISLLLVFLLTVVTGLAIASWFNLPLSDYIAWRCIHVLLSVATLPLLVLKIGLHWRWILAAGRRTLWGMRVSAVSAGSAQPASGPRLSTRRDFMRLMGLVVSAEAGAILSAQNGIVRAFTRLLLPSDPGVSGFPQVRAAGAIASYCSLENAQEEKMTVPAVDSPPIPATSERVPPESERDTPKPLTPAHRRPTTVSAAPRNPAMPKRVPQTRAVPHRPVRCRGNCQWPTRCPRFVDANRNGRCDLAE